MSVIVTIGYTALRVTRASSHCELLMNNRAWINLGLEILVTRPPISSAVIKLKKDKLGYLVAKHSCDLIAEQIKEEFPDALVIKRETRKNFGIYLSITGTRPSELCVDDFLRYYFDTNPLSGIHPIES